ncbi:hypothetical protein [Virgibacillus salexigens]|uniref:hypothetical protein n=1 Tax=Virgibacillus massiliensis TaxID=1462526 RepID=UPI001370CDAB|nr:hypothetical protein [Virgibacillus massiliensis]
MNNSIDKVTFKNLLATTTREKEDSYVVNELFQPLPFYPRVVGCNGRRVIANQRYW